MRENKFFSLLLPAGGGGLLKTGAAGAIGAIGAIGAGGGGEYIGAEGGGPGGGLL
jgi:hypothetical protein